MKKLLDKYRDLIENNYDIIYSMDLNGIFKYISPTWTKILGHNVSSVIKHSFTEFIHPDDIEKCQNWLKEAITKGDKLNGIEYRVKHIDGTWYWHTSAVVVLYNSKKKAIGFNGIAHDITEIVETRKALIASNIFNDKLINTIPFAMCIIDYDCNILFSNKIFNKIFNYDMSGNLWEKYCKSKSYELKDKIKMGIDSGQTMYCESDEIILGKIFEVVHSGMVFNNNNAILEIFIDITKKKQLELDLSVAKDIAENADKLKSSFLANMSHEIRTPLNAIVGFSNLLRTAELNQDSINHYTTIIENSSNQLLAIINDILTIAILDTKGDCPRMVATNINDILENTLSIHINQINDKKINKSLYLDLQTTDSEVYTDRGKLIQILSNLISNAIKFTKEGSIDIGYIIKDKFIEFYVRDTGIGVPEDSFLKIFDKFVQIKDNKNSMVYGLGLGLTISRELVSLLGGEIWLESKIDKGSTFYFTIPYNKVNPTINNIIKIENEYKTILIAEDDETNFIFLSNVLKFEYNNFIILQARNGMEAVDICKSNPEIDVVFMDIKMPIMDGFEASKIIRETRPNLHIIAQTAFALDADIEKYGSVFDAYLTKPLSVKRIKSTLNKLLSDN